MKIKRLTFGGLLLAVTILLPQAFHLTGIPASGAVFLPMHIPVLLSGFLLGPAYGLLIGCLGPLISFLLTDMPSAARLPFMIGEVGFYGFSSGLLYHTLHFSKKKFGITISLIGAMISGRIIYTLMLVIFTYLLHIPCGGPAAAITAFVTGIYGIIIQLLLIPAILYSLKKGGFLDGLYQ